eukprot:8810002-Alexandrium_andersonii.AAC.1
MARSSCSMFIASLESTRRDQVVCSDAVAHCLRSVMLARVARAHRSVCRGIPRSLGQCKSSPARSSNQHER